VEEGDSVAVLEPLVEIGLHSGHGGEFSVYEGDAPLLRRKGEALEEVVKAATFLEIDLCVSEPLPTALRGITGEWSVEPKIDFHSNSPLSILGV
jgi:hypothetical protein